MRYQRNAPTLQCIARGIPANSDRLRFTLAVMGLSAISVPVDEQYTKKVFTLWHFFVGSQIF